MLDESRLRWTEAAWRHIDRENLVKLVRMLVDVPSPTGEEGELAGTIAQYLREYRLNGTTQYLNELQANAVGYLSGRGEGATLLLYAPIDTVTSNSESEDLPWAAKTMRPDFRAASYLRDGCVAGLGAHNPKGHAACIMAAAQAIRDSGIELKGELRLGFGAGGMPTDSRPGLPSNTGHGVGCDFMVKHGPRPDFAVIAKSGWTVSWEEVGFCWFEVRVFGAHTYVGSRHLMPYRNAIHDAVRVIDRLEQWFPRWAEEHRTGLVAPQGVVSFIEAGWQRMPAFTPAMCRFRVDLRISPRSSPKAAREKFGSILLELAKELEVELEWECLTEIAGTTTASDNWIIRSAIAAWETVEGRSHHAVAGMSGATDANILRRNGIPTARVGLPKAKLPDMDFELGMNVVQISDLERLTRHLVAVAIDTCTRSWDELNG